jgi:hypothetical protein
MTTLRGGLHTPLRDAPGVSLSWQKNTGTSSEPLPST